MNTDLQARLETVERLNKWLTAGLTGDEVVAGTIERFNMQSGTRHYTTLAAIHEVAEALDRLAKTIQNNGRTLPP
ncbi:MAG: hypothetical protein WC497_06190 [Patescibacteria group bacterium]